MNLLRRIFRRIVCWTKDHKPSYGHKPDGSIHCSRCGAEIKFVWYGDDYCWRKVGKMPRQEPKP